jgi:hypothetical protein
MSIVRVDWLISYRHWHKQYFVLAWKCESELLHVCTSNPLPWLTKALSKVLSLYPFQTATSNRDVVADFVFKQGCNSKLSKISHDFVILIRSCAKYVSSSSRIRPPSPAASHHQLEPRSRLMSQCMTKAAVDISILEFGALKHLDCRYYKHQQWLW